MSEKITVHDPVAGRVPFRKFILLEKARRAVSWKQLEEMCGFNIAIYAYPQKGKAIYPSHQRLESIAKALEIPIEKIEARGLNSNLPKADSVQNSAGALSSKVHFVRNGERIPFPEFIKRERERRNLTWAELDKFCGVSRMSQYASANSNGRPNNPKNSALHKIIAALGYQESDFEVSRIRRDSAFRGIDKRDYEGGIRKLGEELLSRNLRGEGRRLSSKAIQRILGRPFYNAHGKGLAAREKILADLRKLDKRFANLELQNIDQSSRGESRNLAKDERDFLETRILENLEVMRRGETKRMPHGFLDRILKEFNEHFGRLGRPARTKSSMAYHVQRLWLNKPEGVEFRRQSPVAKKQRSLEIMESRISALDETVAEIPAQMAMRKVLITNEHKSEGLRRFSGFSTEGHTNLVNFLLNEENQRKYLGSDLVLLDVDFPMDFEEQERQAKYTAQIEEIRKRGEEHGARHILEFIDGWLRCDMVFERRSGGFLVVEVKQHAKDRPGGFKNGTKACQQLAAYTAVILDNILRHNTEASINGGASIVKESVEGCLAAYSMDSSVQNHLRRAGNKRPVVIPKAEVEEFMAKEK